MNKYGQSVLTAGCVVTAYAVLVWAMAMMNQPSNLKLYSGLAVIAGLLIVLPLAVWGIWRRR